MINYVMKEFLCHQYPVMVLDVESIGLHGEAFAFGYTCIAEDSVIAHMRWSCPPESAQGSDEDRQWVAENVPAFAPDCASPKELREMFWQQWLQWRQRGALLAADVAWPVEANFLRACVQDDPKTRNWQGPYPLLDIASVLWVAGINPIQSHRRLDGELPAHDPLKDSAQSARLLREAVRKLTALT
jgi:hypothetical protein